MIELPANLLASLVAQARRAAPDEACGWLAGRAGRVERMYPVPNVAENRRSRFVMDPEVQLRSMREIREFGLELTGTYHSHPATSPLPSARDRQLALYPDCAHLIVSLAAREPEVLCYRIGRNGFSPVQTKIL